ncbi:MAG TPA: TonB-dependent receptor [Bryobacteraceae bacterium]|nr:TonB-dependent receptor [Bryobacteraceae bacterium]
MRPIFLSRILSITILATLFGLPPLSAQTAMLKGLVKDESGATVPAANVEIRNANGLVKSTVADSSGAYSFSGLMAGDYSVQASAPNLSQAQPATARIASGTHTLDLHLEVSKIVQQLTVQDTQTGSVSTASADNANALVLRGQDLDALSDDPDDLQADLQALAGPSAGPGGGSIYVDGFSGGEIPPKSSIREIRINQNPFSPEYDKLGLGRIEILTKPGSDRYRGTINYNLGTQLWNSRNPYSAEKAPFLLNEFEGDAGGPLGKRASFTLDAQRNLVHNGSISNGVMVNPQSFALTPFSSTIVTPQALTRLAPRIDYQLNEKNTLTLRYSFTHANITDAGIGALDLASRGYREQYTNQTVQVGESAVLGSAVNETRFQFYRAAIQMLANSDSPEIQVLGSFNGGGSQLGKSFDTQNTFELQNNTSMIRGAHSIRFGIRLRAYTEANISPLDFNGTYSFTGGLGPELNSANQAILDAAGQPILTPISSAEQYRRTLLFQQLGYSPSQIRALGGGASQFTIDSGTPELSVHQFDGALFGGDEWRLRPNLTVNLGLRYEAQTNIHDWKDVAPRVAIAWAPKGPAVLGKTVFRAGFGIFYDRFAITNTLAAQRYNGLVQQQYAVANPDTFPTIPSLGTLAAYRSTQITEEVSSQLRAPYLIQSAVTMERKVGNAVTFAITYSNSHGVHELLSNDINAPLPGTYNPGAASSGVYPLGRPGPLFLMESAGLYNQNQVIANGTARLNSGLSLFGFYVYNKALSNTDGISTFPANPYNVSGEYGPAATDIRHRVTFGGSVNLRGNIRISPFLIMQTGLPFNITSGNDPYGTTLFNARPAFAANPNQAGLIATPYGLLDPNPTAGEEIVPRNYGRGPSQLSLNMRVAKTIGFGGEREHRAKSASSGGGGGSLNPVIAATGRGLGGVIGSPTTSRRYNLTIAMSARNLLNHTNPGPIIGNITSPLFGQATQIAGAPNGEGFYETANNRRLELQIRFAF